MPANRAEALLGALRDAGAKRLTAVIPYLCYTRKDRKTKPRDPVTTRYVAQLFEAVATANQEVVGDARPGACSHSGVPLWRSKARAPPHPT